jgi:hypothetical protein
MHSLFTDFTGREEALRNITRWSIQPVMFYRSNLFTHAKRVHGAVCAATPPARTLLPGFDARRAEILACMHDDIEIIIGDIQAGNKLKMSKEQLDQ